MNINLLNGIISLSFVTLIFENKHIINLLHYYRKNYEKIQFTPFKHFDGIVLVYSM